MQNIPDPSRFADRNPSAPTAIPQTAQASWKIPMPIDAVVEVGVLDAATEADAIQFARELADDLPLEVTLGGVPLEAGFVKPSDDSTKTPP